MNKWEEIQELERDKQTYFDGIEYARQEIEKQNKIIKENLDYIAECNAQIAEKRGKEVENIDMQDDSKHIATE